MANTRAKTQHLFGLRAEEFIAKNAGFVWLITMTCPGNPWQWDYGNKAEAEKRFKSIRDWFDRHGIDFCGVWEMQERGAWHPHILVNKYVDIVAFREFAVSKGWGRFINVRPVGAHHGGGGESPEKLIGYLKKYLSKDLVGQSVGRVRLVFGKWSNRVGTTAFAWVNGWSKVWRAGRAATGLPESTRIPYRCFDAVMALGCDVLGIPQWEWFMRDEIAYAKELSARGDPEGLTLELWLDHVREGLGYAN
jgi:hypothetical protein